MNQQIDPCLCAWFRDFLPELSVARQNVKNYGARAGWFYIRCAQAFELPCARFRKGTRTQKQYGVPREQGIYMCLCVCLCKREWEREFVVVRACTWVRERVCDIYLYIYIYVHMHIYIFFCMKIHVCVFIYIFEYVYICIYIYVYIYMYYDDGNKPTRCKCILKRISTSSNVKTWKFYTHTQSRARYLSLFLSLSLAWRHVLTHAHTRAVHAHTHMKANTRI